MYPGAGSIADSIIKHLCLYDLGQIRAKKTRAQENAVETLTGHRQATDQAILEALWTKMENMRLLSVTQRFNRLASEGKLDLSED